MLLLQMGNLMPYHGVNFGFVQVLQQIVGQIDISSGVSKSVRHANGPRWQYKKLIEFYAGFFSQGKRAVAKLAGGKRMKFKPIRANKSLGGEPTRNDSSGDKQLHDPECDKWKWERKSSYRSK